uniref:Nondiscriminating glutamyl-tRNA synthetase EARS2, mitochondrial n=1 Tax=Ciona savignyi TaxID=51511 RepID=H2ZFM2_CIOSA
QNVRVRFAPSPTGFLHIGGLRTALYNYLFACANNGKFIVRIEDTDRTRIVEGAASSMLSTLERIGLHPDESPKHGGEYGPYVQSERLQHYQRVAHELIQNGAAYRCFCSPRRLSILKKDQRRRKETERYDNRCRDLTEGNIACNVAEGKPFVIRLKLKANFISIKDALFGKVGHNSYFEGDPVLLKSDGFPTYHLANVVDDHMMQISHVIRGKEWLTSTSKHVQIYEALGWDLPTFIHLPLLINTDGSKLSKRQVGKFFSGYSPSALLNFMAYYGSGFPGLRFYLISSYHSSQLVLSDAIVNFSKLDEFSTILTKYILDGNKSELQHMREALYKLVQQKYATTHAVVLPLLTQYKYLNIKLLTTQGHITKLNDLILKEYQYLWIRPEVQILPDHKVFHEAVCSLIRHLNTISWTSQDIESISSILSQHCKENGCSYPNLMKFLRQVFTNKEQGPKIADLLHMLGREETVCRLNNALSS